MPTLENEIDVPSPRSEAILDGLFGTEADTEEAISEEVEETLEEEIEEEEVVEEEDNSDDDEEEIDYDSEDEKPEEEEEEEEKPLEESVAQREAKIRGREAKELKTKLTETELELSRIKDELKAKQDKLDEIETTQIKPHEHPDYLSAREAILNDARLVARRLQGDSKALLGKNFGLLMDTFLEAAEAPADKAAEADEKLTAVIVDNLKLSDVSYEEMDQDERNAVMPTVDRIMGLLERNAEKTRDLQKLYMKLESRAKTGKITVGYREYEQREKEFSPIVESVGDVPEEVLEEKPHSIEAVVAKLVKSSPEAKKRLEKAKKDVLSALIGPRALTQTDIDKLEANGTDIKEYLVERDRLHQNKLKKLAPMFVQALVTRAEFSKYVEKASKADGTDNSAESEFDAVQKVSKKKPQVKSPVKVDPRKRDPLASMFGESDEDDW
jgi:hypothetical protein